MALSGCLRAASLAACGLSLLSGCAAPDYLLLEKASTEHLETRLGTIERQIEVLAKAQERTAELAHEAQLARIAGAMEAQLERRWQVPLHGLAACSSQERSEECPEASSPSDSRLREGQQVSAEGMLVFGAVEQVQLDPPGLLFEARMDTGAATSSLDARQVEEFERDGEPWVRFEILDPEGGDGRIAIVCRRQSGSRWGGLGCHQGAVGRVDPL